MKTIEYENFIREEGFELGEKRGMEQGKEQGREQGICACIHTCQKVSMTKQETVQNIMEQFQMSDIKAEEMMDKYWK